MKKWLTPSRYWTVIFFIFGFFLANHDRHVSAYLILLICIPTGFLVGRAFERIEKTKKPKTRHRARAKIFQRTKSKS